MSNVTPSATNPVISAGGNFQINEKTADGRFVTLSFASLLIWAGLKSLEGSRAAFNTQFTIAQNKVGVMQELNNLMQLANNLKALFTSGDNSDAKKLMSPEFAKALDELMAKYPNMVQKPDGLAAGEAGLIDSANRQILIDKLQDLRNDKLKEEEAANIFSPEYMQLKAERLELEKLRKSLLDAKEENGYFPLNKDQMEFLRKNPDLELSYAPSYEITRGNLESFISNLQTAQSTLSSENEQQSMRTNQAMNRSSGFLQQLQGLMQTAKEALQAATKAGAA